MLSLPTNNDLLPPGGNSLPKLELRRALADMEPVRPNFFQTARFEPGFVDMLFKIGTGVDPWDRLSELQIKKRSELLRQSSGCACPLLLKPLHKAAARPSTSPQQRAPRPALLFQRAEVPLGRFPRGL